MYITFTFMRSDALNLTYLQISSDKTRQYIIKIKNLAMNKTIY